MIKIDTTELEEQLKNLDAGQMDLARFIDGLQRREEARDKEIQELRDKISVLQTQALHDSKTLFGVKPSRLKETTIIDPKFT